MKNLLPLLLLFCLALPAGAQVKPDWKKLAENPEYLHRSVKEVTDVMVHDIYSPPVAARIYAYVTVAAYEAAYHGDAAYISFDGQLHGLTNVPQPEAGKQYSFPLAAVNALLQVAKTMIISEERIGAFQSAILQEYNTSGMPADVFDNSVAYGKKIAEHIMAWAAKDRYKETRSLSKYSVGTDAASWKPTPPSYMKAIEPHWGELRTFLIDSAQQFRPLPPTTFSIDSTSQFYKEARDVQNARINLTPEQNEIANFWDCNPFKMNINGHVMYATKKISPGGHWINITRLACKQNNAGFVQSSEAYACLSVTLADGFISCWDEKFRSKCIRPETYINQYISQSWLPLLQTPPFPEYTSGHSVVSAACSVILTKLFGDHFAYSDSTEVEFGIPVRHFKSFKQAADEAAISRFYGGIHYMPSITNGLDEGDKIGVFVANKLRTKK
ncbi:vanadium-dependent haloperoxidase [Ferruginibacter paludis]|uniref:vanadium-dependent haloperoxidase n=1 Tax=Ferruginibacter paludis TaxID=1310417 RepID=UPI0025B40DFC|nr:vanadium-dependent haloperoxidase [Ferruginibacter paludis]MDN3656860.1 vanadium-dependent haloperoxidase [Ferruginibacter paludis]